VTMKLDEALSLVGAYGRYQLVVFVTISVFDNFPSIMHMSIATFIGYEPPHRCTVLLHHSPRETKLSSSFVNKCVQLISKLTNYYISRES